MGSETTGTTQSMTHSGTVTFLFSDIEGSTRLLQSLGDAHADLLSRHHEVVRRAVTGSNGRVIDTAGDGFFIAFTRARDAIDAAVSAQRSIAETRFPGDHAVRIRMGIHTGEPSVASEGCVGLDVHRAARICSAAVGGQVLLSKVSALLENGNIDRAGAVLDEARAIWAHAGSLRAIGMMSSPLFVLFEVTGDEGARDRLVESLRLAASMRDVPTLLDVIELALPFLSNSLGPHRAASLIGLTDAQCALVERVPSPARLAARRSIEGTLRDALGEQVFNQAHRSGQTLPLEDIAADIISAVHR